MPAENANRAQPRLNSALRLAVRYHDFIRMPVQLFWGHPAANVILTQNIVQVLLAMPFVKHLRLRDVAFTHPCQLLGGKVVEFFQNFPPKKLHAF
jgi:hypothetical protein